MREWAVETTISICAFLLPIAWIALAVVFFILLPMAAWRRTRAAAATGLFISSYVFGTTTWFLGAAITFASFGWFGFILSLVLLGIGVVPLDIVGAFFKLDINSLAVGMCVMLIVTFATRFGAAHLMAKSIT